MVTQTVEHKSDRNSHRLLEKDVKLPGTKRIRCALPVLVASALALSLVACGEKSSPEKVGKDTDRAGAQSGGKLEEVTTAAEKKVQQAENLVGEKTAEASKAIGDTALTAKIKAALLAEPNLKSLAIDISTSDGIVTLYGTVDTPAIRDRVVQVVSGVNGVKSVKNNLVVLKGS